MGTEKKADLSAVERNKIIKSAILSGSVAALIGAIRRDFKSKEDRKKMMDAYSSKNAIIVPIKKTNFMKDVATPEQVAESRGETFKKDDVPAIEEKKDDAHQIQSTDSELAAKKKDIIRNRSREFDFFRGRKAASYKDSEASDKSDKNDGRQAKDDGESSKNTDAPEAVSDEKGKGGYDASSMPRDQSGRFVSPTDPVAVIPEEKKADGGGGRILNWFNSIDWSDAFLHPFDTVAHSANSFVGKPLYITAGMLGSIYLASKLSEAINKRRKEKSELLLDESRKEYVKKLEDSDDSGGESEKTAGDNPGNVFGNLFGYAFWPSAAITALVTHKIIENRKEDKKKKKERSDSYPDDSYILYKVSEDKSFEIEPETALALMIIKQAAITYEEMEEASGSLVKSAQLQGLLPQVVGYAKRKIPGFIKDEFVTKPEYSDEEMSNALDWGLDYANREENEDNLLNLIKAYGYVDANGRPNKKRVSEAYDKFKPTLSYVNERALKGAPSVGLARSPEFRRRLMSDKRFSDMLAYKMNNNPKFKQYRDSMIDRYIGGTMFGSTWIGTILSWLAKNTGIGSYFVNKSIRDRLNRMANPAQANTSPDNNGQGAGAGSKANVGASGSTVSPADGGLTADEIFDYNNPEHVREASNFADEHHLTPPPYVKNERGEVVPNPERNGTDPASQAEVQSTWNDYVAARNLPKTVPGPMPAVSTGDPPIPQPPPITHLPKRQEMSQMPRQEVPPVASLSPSGFVTSMPVHPGPDGTDFEPLPPETPLTGGALDAAMDLGYVPEKTPVSNQKKIDFSLGDTQDIANSMYQDADLRP